MKDGNKRLYRVETTVNANEPDKRKSSFVDWYWGETEQQALEVWDEDCHRYGLPMDKVTKTVREATESERQASEMS